MKKLLRILLLYIPLGLIATSVLWVVVLKWVPVVRTPLMDIRAREFRRSCAEDGSIRVHARKDWVPLEEISENMVMAVIASEDNRFMEHKGFDKVEILNALEERKAGKRIRGASTISQQTAKNVFLPPTRSWARKAVEVWFTFLIEKIWGKERIMEVYLNVIETGKGIYGVQAAARYYFGTDASRLTERQASLIAAALPSPLKRDPAHPSAYMNRRSHQILSLMHKVARPEWQSGDFQNF